MTRPTWLALLVAACGMTATAADARVYTGGKDLGKEWRVYLATHRLTEPKIDFPYQHCFERAADRHDLPLTLLIAVARAGATTPQGLAPVRPVDDVAALEIGDRAGNSQNLVVSSRREPQLLDTRFQQVHAGRAQWAELSDLSGIHLCVTSSRDGLKTVQLQSPRLSHLFAHVCA